MVWFDAHADFNTPETSPSGFLDGMAVAILTGRCWRSLAAQITGFEVVPESRVALVGIRDLDPPEADALAASRVRRIGSDLTGLDAVFPQVVQRGSTLTWTSSIQEKDEANQFATTGGLTAAQLVDAVRRLSRRPLHYRSCVHLI